MVSEVIVVVPVYRGFEDTQRCLSSIIAARNSCPWHLLIIDDYSPEPELSNWLNHFAKAHQEKVSLLRNDVNLGFVRSVNYGLRMALSLGADAVLLNSDTEVSNHWLDCLHAACHQEPRIGTATPWSNHATIFSYPAYPHGGNLPAGETTASLSSLCRTYFSGQVLEVPTAHGFCMYIRYDCLSDVGFFDEEAFGKGYGEENDFCLRASRKGWHHVHALDTYVFHRGSVSFGTERDARIENALKIIRKRYPDYEATIQELIARDPWRRYRFMLDVARTVSCQKSRILLISHDREGGVERHQRELVQHFAKSAIFVRLKPSPGGVCWYLANGSGEKSYYRFPAQYHELINDLQQLDIQHVHYHHWLGLPAEMLRLASDLGVSYDVTLHDHYSYCPQLHFTKDGHHYCGEIGLEQCQQCLQDQPAPDGTRDIIAWRQRHREFLMAARYVIAPSHDVANRTKRYFGIITHVAYNDQLCPSKNHWPIPRPITRSDSSSSTTLRVVVLGALSQLKGADLLEAVSILAAQKQASVEFHLLGYAYRHLITVPKSALTVHGPYRDEELPLLLQKLQPHLIWLPSRVPETYSYTLSAALSGGWPVATADLGAFAERLDGRPWSWLLPQEAGAAEWLAFFVDLQKRYLQEQHPQPTIPVARTKVEQEHCGHPFDYQRHYLPASTPHPNPDRAIALLGASPRTQPPQGNATRTKRLVLQGLVRMRSFPLLRLVVAKIPLPLQRRIKQWLIS